MGTDDGFGGWNGDIRARTYLVSRSMRTGLSFSFLA